MAMTVTAQQVSNPANGMALRVFVLTGAKAAASQTGGTAHAAVTGSTAYTATGTVQQSSSRIYGAAVEGGVKTNSGSGTTVVDSIQDSTNSQTYVTFKQAAPSTGSQTLGVTASSSSSGGVAWLEVLASGTLAEDMSSPAVVSTTSAQSVTTASFTPPAGSLLVALVSADGGSGVETVTVSGGGLTWTEVVKNNTANDDYCGVWIADGPASAGVSGQVQPRATVPVPRRRLLRAVWAGIKGQGKVAVPAPRQPPYVPPRRKPARAVWAGSRPFTGFVAVPAPRQLPPVPRRAPGRAYWRGSAPFTGFVAVPPPRQVPPVPRRPPGRAVWRGSAPAPVPAVAVPPPRRLPPVPRRTLARAVAGGIAVPPPLPPVRLLQLAWRERPAPGRAVVQFTPVRTVNAAAPVQVVGGPPQVRDDKGYIKKLAYLIG